MSKDVAPLISVAPPGTEWSASSSVRF